MEGLNFFPICPSARVSSAGRTCQAWEPSHASLTHTARAVGPGGGFRLRCLALPRPYPDDDLPDGRGQPVSLLRCPPHPGRWRLVRRGVRSRPRLRAGAAALRVLERCVHVPGPPGGLVPGSAPRHVGRVLQPPRPSPARLLPAAARRVRVGPLSRGLRLQHAAQGPRGFARAGLQRAAPELPRAEQSSAAEQRWRLEPASSRGPGPRQHAGAGWWLGQPVSAERRW
jgi:hypothetical protein